MTKVEELNNKGFVKLNEMLDNEFCQEINFAIENAYKACRQVQIKNGIEEVTDGTVHHLLLHSNPVFLNLLEIICKSSNYSLIKEFFQGNFIINSYGGVKNIKGKPSYVANIHRDIRFFSNGFPLMLNLLIMLDDFTLENGATYVLSESHKYPDKPSDEDFYKKAERITGKRGDFVFFDSNLWHAAGVNLTDTERRAITITFTKPFMKQQLDYSKAVREERINTLDEKVQQIIGYFSRTPSTLDEWYRKPEERFYRPGQD